MIVIVGMVVVIGSVLVGFMWEGGDPRALLQPAELLVIGGSSLGAMILMSPKKILIDLLRGIAQCVKGTPYGKAAYEELFKVLYDLLRVARRDGLIALEAHVTEPQQSELFAKYPRIVNNHHVVEFIAGALGPLVEGTGKPEQLNGMLAEEIKMIAEEQHAPIAVLMKVADALPGFGIVAAVLGIVITMGAIDGPPEEVGEKVGAALVGTFLGILLSYGFFGPLAVKMESLGEAELGYFRAIVASMQGFLGDVPAKVALENARRGVSTEVRPKRERLEELLREVDVG
jgi:chemotaxis protein MotA